MKWGRLSKDQIIAVLKEHETVFPTAEVCRRNAISSACSFKWKSMIRQGPKQRGSLDFV